MRRTTRLLLFATVLVVGLTALAWLRTRSDIIPNSRPRIVWQFEPPQRGGIVAGLTLDGDVIFAAAVRDAGLGSTSGAVYGLNRFTGRPLWEFDDRGEMLHTISSPLFHAGRLYVGEGMHGDVVCKLYCLDAGTGSKRWSRAFGGHIESGPRAAGQQILATAGDDGLHAVEAATGKSRWSYRASGHVDAAPAVGGERLFGGSGVSRRFATPEVFCLRLRDGEPIWRVPAPLPVWGSPVLDGEGLFVPVGNGRLTSSEPPPGKPAGALLRVAPGDGTIVWRADADDGVLARPAVDAERAYFVSRDSFAYAVYRDTGVRAWKHDLGSPVVAAPALEGDRLYVISSDGLLACLDADTGERVWSFDFGRYSPARPRLLSGPLVAPGPKGQRWVYVGTELRGAGGAAAVLFCIEAPTS